MPIKTRKHLTTHLNKALVYSQLISNHPTGCIDKGEWMWAIKETEKHYYILSAKTEGWISKTDCADLSGYDLQVKMINNAPHYYLQVA